MSSSASSSPAGSETLAGASASALRDLRTFAAFPSVSAQPAHAADVRACAAWLARHLAGIGLERARVIETRGHPIVTAEWRHALDRPTVLIYGHYDVQPAEPLNAWRTPPVRAHHPGRRHLRSRSGGRQGTAPGPRQGAGALVGGSSRPARQRRLSLRGRGRDRQPPPRAGAARRGPWPPRRCGGDLGYPDARPSSPGADVLAAGSAESGSGGPRTGARPSLRHLRRHGAQPAPGPRRAAWPVACSGRTRRGRRVLRPGAGCGRRGAGGDAAPGSDGCRAAGPGGRHPRLGRNGLQPCTSAAPCGRRSRSTGSSEDTRGAGTHAVIPAAPRPSSTCGWCPTRPPMRSSGCCEPMSPRPPLRP